MKKVIWICFWVVFCGSCQRSDYEPLAPCIDSFVIDYLYRPADLNFLQERAGVYSGFCAADQVLVSYQMEHRLLRFRARDPINASRLLTASWLDPSGVRYYISSRSELLQSDTNAATTPHLVRRLVDSGTDCSMSVSASQAPIFFEGDTIVFFTAYGNNPDLSVRSGPILFRFGKSGSHAFFPRPAALRRHIQIIPSYCLQGSKIVMLYPGIDSLYTVDLRTNSQSSHYIGNPEYIPQTDADPALLFDVGKSTQYYASNFTYGGIFFNEQTRHFVLLYNLPSGNTAVLLADEKIAGALVLDEDFRRIGNYSFSHPAWIGLAFPIASGLVIPTDPQKHNGNAYRNLQCFIYRF